MADLDTATVDAKDSIVTTKTELEAFDDGVKALDKSVAEATEQRKEDNEDYTVLMSSAAAAKELIGFAKDGLNKFDNPKMYKPPAGGLAQVRAHNGEAPPPAPQEPQKHQKSGEPQPKQKRITLSAKQKPKSQAIV